MKCLRNESGSILVLATLMIVLLLIFVGMGLDTGWLAYNRAQGQPAMDAAALTGVTGIPTGDPNAIKTRIEELNLTNDYVKSLANPIDGTVNGPNVTLVKYDPATQTITQVGSLPAGANGIRVALEETNPYTTDTSGTSINTPTFLTPLLNLFGANVSSIANVNVSAVAALKALPSMPVVVTGCPALESTNPWCNDQVDATGNSVPKLCAGGCTSSGGVVTGTNCQLIRHPDPSDTAGWTNLMPSGPTSEDAVEELLDATKSCEKNNQFSSVGQPICLNNGNIPPLVKRVDELFGNDGWSQPEDCFLIPYVDQKISTINQCETLKGWATLCISAVQSKNPFAIYGDLSCPSDLFNTSTQCYKPVLLRDTKSGM